MELRELRAFVAVVEEGGLSPAARRLHLSQPALSQLIGGLERRLAVRLLVRSRTGTTPTDAGWKLLTHARAVLRTHDQAEAAMAAYTGSEAAGELRLGIPLELPATWLDPPLAALAASHPQTTVRPTHLSTAGQLAMLRSGELEVGLVREHPIGDDLDAVPVLREPLGVLLSGEVAATVAEPDAGVRLDRLVGLEWVAFPRADSPAWYDGVVAILRSHGLHGGPPSAAGSSLIPEVKFAAVASGRAFSLAPPNWSQPLPASLRWLPLIDNPLIRRTWATWPATSRRRDVAFLIDTLESAMGDITGFNP